MMALKKGSLNAAQAETYYEEKYTVDDYYSEQHRVTGQWYGKLAAELGLSGEVAHEDFSTLLQGVDPHSGNTLVHEASGNHKIKHAAGWDAVFNAPKSVSIQALIGEDHRLIQAHCQAVERALAEVEKYSMARQHGGREFVPTGNVVAAAFTHVAARPIEKVNYGPDPHLHTHAVFLNITRRPDGEIRALAPVEIYRSQTIGSAVYRSELSREVQRLGYQIQVTKADGAWELQGYSREQVMAFSNRRQQIEKDMAEQGLSGAKAAQIVTLKTRQPKEQYDQEELKAEWKERAAEQGIDARQMLWQALGHGDAYNGKDRDLQEAFAYAKAHVYNREAVVDRRELEANALQFGMGRISLDAVRRQMDTEERAQRLLPKIEPDHRHPQGAFTTPEMVALEAENVRLMREGQGQAKPIATQLVVESWGQRKGLSDEQSAAAAMMLTSTNWITAIDALAGTGKTYTVNAIKELAEQQGYTVHAFGPTTRSVQELQHAGLRNAVTIASLLHNDLPASAGAELWFVDEHSMMGSLTANRLLKAARQQGTVRIILVGDGGQHQAIQAGNPVKQFIDAEMTVARLETIRRQEKAEMREAVKAARYTPAKAFDLLDEQGRIVEIPDVKERYATIAGEYLKSREAGQNVLVVSAGNDERKQLNAAIRAKLVKHGLVKDGGRNQEIRIDRKLTPAQIKTANSYQEGDVIFVHGTREQQKRGITKNSYATVEAVDRRGNALMLRTEDNRRVEIYPAKWKDSDAEVFTTERRTLAVGDSVQFRRPDKKHHIANGDFATLLELTGSGAKFHFDGKQPRDVTLPFADMKHLDYGYCSTTYSAQGATVQNCIIQADSMRSEKLLNRSGWYVAVSRPKIELRIFTDDAEALRRAIQRNPQKAIALEAVKQQQQIQPQQSQSPGINI